MRSKYFLKKNNNKKNKKKINFEYNTPISASLYNCTLFKTENKIINKYNKNEQKNKQVYNIDNVEKNIKLNLIDKYEQIKKQWNEYRNLMYKIKLKNKELKKYIKCEKCKNETIVKEGKYGTYLICKNCNIKVSKEYIDNFIFKCKEKDFFKKRNRICFEIENKNSFRIHSFGNVDIGIELNKIITECIKEIILDIKKIKKNKWKYRHIIRYIMQINIPYNRKEYYNIYKYKKISNYFNFSFNRKKNIFLLKKNNFNYKWKNNKNKIFEYFFIYKFEKYIKQKIEFNKENKNKWKQKINYFINHFFKNDFFNEMNYLPLTWLCRKDYINSNIYPYYLLKNVKKKETFRRLSINEKYYLSGALFNLCAYQLIIRYFIFKLFDSYFIYEIPNTIFYFFKHFYKIYNDKNDVYKYFLKNNYINIKNKLYKNYQIQLKNLENKIYNIKNINNIEKMKILNSYNFKKLCHSTFFFNEKKLEKEVLNYYFNKQKKKLQTKFYKQMKQYCLLQIKKKLPVEIQRIILPYQLETIYFFKKKKGRILISDEMGLGKTLQSISIFFFYKLYPVLIIVPSSLKIQWMLEIQNYLTSIQSNQILIISSFDDIPKQYIKYKIIIISYNMFKKFYRNLEINRYPILILDESHYIRTPYYGNKSILTKIIKKIIQIIPYIIFISSTPSINRPINIYHQIKYLINNNNIFFKNKYIFGEECCNKIFNRGYHIYEQNLRSWEFSFYLKKIVMIRRIYSNILQNNLPSIKRFFIYINNPNINNSHINNPNINNSHINNPNINNSNINNPNINNSHIIYNNNYIINKFKSNKEKEGFFKISSSLNWIEKYFPKKKKIIFCYHLNICKYIEDEILKIIEYKNKEYKEIFNYVTINGTLNEKEKLEKINDFKNNKKCLYGIFTICSVSHGFDFTFINLCFFIEFPVNFFHLHQCERRIYRRNQKKNTYVFYFILKNGIGSDIITWKRFLNCFNSIRCIIDGTILDNNELSIDNFSLDIINKINENNKINNNINENNKINNNKINNNNINNNKINENKKKNYSIDKKNKKNYVNKKKLFFKINPLTNIVHTYYNNKKKFNFSIDKIKNVNINIRKYANKFIENYKKLNPNEKKLIDNKKCDMNITSLKFKNEEKRNNISFNYERYLKNIPKKNKKYIKAYIEYGFKGKFKQFYYQEFKENLNTFLCLLCKKDLPYSKTRIYDENEVINYLHKNNIENAKHIIKEIKEIKENKLNKNIKHIIICNENDLFCEGKCRKNYFIKTNSNTIRRLIYERDKGICNNCNLDSNQLLNEIKTMKYFSFEEKIHYFINKYPLFLQNLKNLKKIIQHPKKGLIWQTDHILPVYKGGGLSSLDNFQTLCTFCHKEKTKNDLKNKNIFKKVIKSKYFK